MKIFKTIKMALIAETVRSNIKQMINEIKENKLVNKYLNFNILLSFFFSLHLLRYFPVLECSSANVLESQFEFELNEIATNKT